MWPSDCGLVDQAFLRALTVYFLIDICLLLTLRNQISVREVAVLFHMSKFFFLEERSHENAV